MNGDGFVNIFSEYLIAHNGSVTLRFLSQIIAIGTTQIARCAYWFYDYGVMTIV
jgi:hypothetical protein